MGEDLSFPFLISSSLPRPIPVSLSFLLSSLSPEFYSVFLLVFLCQVWKCEQVYSSLKILYFTPLLRKLFISFFPFTAQTNCCFQWLMAHASFIHCNLLMALLWAPKGHQWLSSCQRNDFFSVLIFFNHFAISQLLHIVAETAGWAPNVPFPPSFLPAQLQLYSELWRVQLRGNISQPLLQ